MNNEFKLIHRNEMKNQLNGQLQQNQLYFRYKWGLDEDRKRMISANTIVYEINITAAEG